MSTVVVPAGRELRRNLRKVSLAAADLVLATEQTDAGTDYCDLWAHPDCADVWLLDSNNLPRSATTELISLVSPLLNGPPRTTPTSMACWTRQLLGRASWAACWRRRYVRILELQNHTVTG